MGRAGQIVWRVLRVLLALVLLLALLALAAWWGLPRLPPSEAQREAMALMRDAPESTGRNAWAAVWFLNKAVPEDQMLDLADADVADWQALLRRGDVSAQAAMDWRPPSDASFPPELPFDDERPPLCERCERRPRKERAVGACLGAGRLPGRGACAACPICAVAESAQACAGPHRCAG